MNDEELSKYRAKILKSLSALDKEIVSLKNLTKPIAPDRSIGRLSRMEAINDKAVHEANLAKAKNRTLGLKKALERIEDGTFGYCVKCEEPIPNKRLELLPETTLCMDCLREKP